MKTLHAEKTARPVSWLLVFFGLAYFCQHFSQAGLITQPLTFYFKEVLHYGADQIATFFAILTLPWMIKPLYGLISDRFPLLGYRRKSYLLILNLFAAGGFLWITGVSDTSAVRMALLLTAFCTAFSDVAIDGLMVELGKKTGMTAQYQSMQWLWFNVAMVISSFAGGMFTEYLPADSAFKVAAGITALFPLLITVGTWLWVTEDKVVKDPTPRSNPGVKFLRALVTGSATDIRSSASEISRNSWQAFLAVLKLRTLWLVMGFIMFWQFSPSLGTPFFMHMTDTLKFSQKFIGTLGAIGSVAAVIGALVFNRVLAGRYNTKTLLYWSAFFGVISTISYLLLINPATTGTPATAIALSFVFGITGQISILTILNLAAAACPPKAEALTFAVLMSVYNLSAQGSSIFGGWLYERVFDKSLFPLIIVSAVFTALCLPLIRFLPREEEPVAEEGEKSKDNNSPTGSESIEQNKD